MSENEETVEPENTETAEPVNVETAEPEKIEPSDSENTEETCEANKAAREEEEAAAKKADSETPVECPADAPEEDGIADEKLTPFKASVNVENFTADEVAVNVRNEIRTILIEAKHYENSDDIRFISKEFTRKFTVPDRYNLDDMTKKIENGVLFIEVPIGSSALSQSDKIAAKCTACAAFSELKRPEFKAEVNISQYQPDEIAVNSNPESRMISVEAKHMERSEDMMFIARQFTRKFTVPPRYKLDEMYHKIQDGVLSIHIPIDPTTIAEKAIKE